jgi:hypothetical protein
VVTPALAAAPRRERLAQMLAFARQAILPRPSIMFFVAVDGKLPARRTKRPAQSVACRLRILVPEPVSMPTPAQRPASMRVAPALESMPMPVPVLALTLTAHEPALTPMRGPAHVLMPTALELALTPLRAAALASMPVLE